MQGLPEPAGAYALGSPVHDGGMAGFDAEVRPRLPRARMPELMHHAGGHDRGHAARVRGERGADRAAARAVA
jgi:hypothetical protein